MALTDLVPAPARLNLRTRMHKVAAVMARNEGLQLPPGEDEITLKTAAYLLGVQIFRHRREKQAMLDGIMNIARL
jgi:hypothetical protein